MNSKDDGCPKKPPVVNNSGNNSNNGNNNGQSADCFVHEAKSIRYDPSRTQSNLVYNPVGIDLELTGKEKRVRNWVYAFMLTMV